MKISDTKSPVSELVSQQITNEKKVNSEPGKQLADKAIADEKVSLSSAAKDIQRAEKAIKELPDVREEKVQELKSQIEAGQYNVNGEKIAEKMVSESLMDIMV